MPLVSLVKGVGAGGRSVMLNPITNKKSILKEKQKNIQVPKTCYYASIFCTGLLKHRMTRYRIRVPIFSENVFKDRQQEAEHHSSRLTQLSSYVLERIILYTK